MRPPFLAKRCHSYHRWSCNVSEHCNSMPLICTLGVSPGIYRWRNILADTDFFQQSVSVSATDIRGRNNRPSAKHFFIKLSAKQFSCSWAFRSLCQHNKTCRSVHKVVIRFWHLYSNMCPGLHALVCWQSKCWTSVICPWKHCQC